MLPALFRQLHVSVFPRHFRIAEQSSHTSERGVSLCFYLHQRALEKELYPFFSHFVSFGLPSYLCFIENLSSLEEAVHAYEDAANVGGESPASYRCHDVPGGSSDVLGPLIRIEWIGFQIRLYGEEEAVSDGLYEQ